MNEPYAESRRVINPFVFPSELSFYFILIIITIFAPAFTLAFSALRDLLDPSFQLSMSLHSLIWLPVITIILLPFLIIFFYKRNVENKIRKYGKNKVEDKYPEFSSIIYHISENMGVKTPASFYTDEEILNSYVFGYRKQTYMLVSRDLCENLNLFPEIVKTIITHELSHLKNNDVNQHEIAEASWKSFGIVSLISIILILTVNYSLSWLFVILFSYVIPFIVVFYLNNVIRRWREIYADLRTMILQKSDKNIFLALRLLNPSFKTGWKKIFSPFILIPLERIKILKEEPAKHILERGLLCSGLSIFSLGSALVSLALLWDFENHWFSYSIIAIWSIISYYLIFVVTLPYWGNIWKRRVEGLKELAIRTLIVPLKITPIFSVSFFFFSTMASGLLFSMLDLYFFFFLVNYLLLIIYQCFFCLMLSLVSLKINPVIKFNIPALIMFFFFAPFFPILYFQLPDYLAFLCACIGIILISLLLVFLNKRYLRCPYCNNKPTYKKSLKLYGREITFEFIDYFKCPYCTNRFNEELFILISK